MRFELLQIVIENHFLTRLDWSKLVSTDLNRSEQNNEPLKEATLFHFRTGNHNFSLQMNERQTLIHIWIRTHVSKISKVNPGQGFLRPELRGPEAPELIFQLSAVSNGSHHFKNSPKFKFGETL